MDENRKPSNYNREDWIMDQDTWRAKPVSGSNFTHQGQESSNATGSDNRLNPNYDAGAYATGHNNRYGGQQGFGEASGPGVPKTEKHRQAEAPRTYAQAAHRSTPPASSQQPQADQADVDMDWESMSQPQVAQDTASIGPQTTRPTEPPTYNTTPPATGQNGGTELQLDDNATREDDEPPEWQMNAPSVHWDPSHRPVKQFMILTEQAFSWRQSRPDEGPFMNYMRDLINEARYDETVIKLTKVQPLIESEQVVGEFYGNRYAGEVMELVQRDWLAVHERNKYLIEEVREAEAAKREQKRAARPTWDLSKDWLDLGIDYEHIMVLMAKNLHTRYRTMWQIGANIGLIPPSWEEKEQNGVHAYDIDLDDYGGFEPHKRRYDLCTALAHSGSLRDDLVVGTSKYLDVWQVTEDPNHRVKRRRLFQRLFEEIYQMDYETAQWIVTAADIYDVKPAQQWLRLIDRFFYALDCSYTHGRRRAPPGEISYVNVEDDFRELRNARASYATWAQHLRDLVAVQQRSYREAVQRGEYSEEGQQPEELVQVQRSRVLYALTRRQVNDIKQKTEFFFSTVYRQMTINWDRVKHFRETPFPTWEPAKSLQSDYNNPLWVHRPFGAPVRNWEK